MNTTKPTTAVTVVNCTLNYLDDQINNLRLAMGKNQREEMKEIANDMFSEIEKLVAQIDDHFIKTGK